MSINSRPKATKIIGQRKPFNRQRIPDPSCLRKTTFDIDILETSRNGDWKIMQSIRITSRDHSQKWTPYLMLPHILNHIGNKKVSLTLTFWCFIKLNGWAFQWKKNKILWLPMSKVMASTSEREICGWKFCGWHHLINKKLRFTQEI